MISALQNDTNTKESAHALIKTQHSDCTQQLRHPGHGETGAIQKEGFVLYYGEWGLID